MTAKEGKEAHYSRGRRHLPPAAAVAGLVVLAFCWSLSGSGPRPLQTVELSEEQLEQLVARVQSPHVALQHAVARRYGPTAPPSTRGGKYVVTSVMGLDPERLNIFVASLRRWSPATRLVVFVEERTDATLLREAGATVFPFVARNDSALVLNRCASAVGGGGVRWEAGKHPGRRRALTAAYNSLVAGLWPAADPARSSTTPLARHAGGFRAGAALAMRRIPPFVSPHATT